MVAERVVLRRRHSAQLKALVLEQCVAPGASVAVDLLVVVSEPAAPAYLSKGQRRVSQPVRFGCAVRRVGVHPRRSASRSAVVRNAHAQDHAGRQAGSCMAEALTSKAWVVAWQYWCY